MDFRILSPLIISLSLAPVLIDISLAHHHVNLFPEPEPHMMPPNVVFPGDPINYPRGRGMRFDPRSYEVQGGNGRCGGVCVHPTYCATLGGTPKGLCPTGAGVCCAFEKSCNEVTSEISSFFNSPGYPGPTLGTLICQYDILIQPGVCGVRLEFKEFNTTNPLDRGLCNIDQLIVMNSLEGATFPRCGELTGYTTIVPVDPRHRLPLTLLSIIQSSMEQFKWNIKFTQLKCDGVRRVEDHPGCGKKFAEAEPLDESVTEIPKSQTTTTTTPESDNQIPGSSDVEQVYFSRQTVDNAFYIAYLKQAHEAIVSGNETTNANNTLCKNRASDIELEKRQQMRSGEDELGRIIRGDEALINEFPWQISIQDKKGHICGGAIIDDMSILTASHCFLSVSPVPVSTVKIIVGDLNLNITTEAKEESVEVDSVIFHSHFDPYYLENDIAIIRLKKPLKFRPGVQPVCLPEKGNSYAGRKAVISGWGATSYPQGKLGTSLQRAYNDIIENSECKKKLKIEYIYSTMMCAVAGNCSGTCFGDSGGPLVVEKEGKNTLVGLVSFGIGGCALFPYWPDVYTRVSTYLDWISYAINSQ